MQLDRVRLQIAENGAPRLKVPRDLPPGPGPRGERAVIAQSTRAEPDFPTHTWSSPDVAPAHGQVRHGNPEE